MSYYTVIPNIYNRPVMNMPINHPYQALQAPNLLQSNLVNYLVLSLALKKST